MSQTAKTDSESGALVTLEWHDELVHNGRMWHSSSTNIPVAIAGVTDFILRIDPDGYHTHFWYRVESTGETHIDLYEDPAITVDGNARIPQNVNRVFYGVAVTTVTCFSGCTTGALGRYLSTRLIGAGGGKVGGVADSASAWHGQVGEEYLLRVTTLANNLNIAVTWRFHEEI